MATKASRVGAYHSNPFVFCAPSALQSVDGGKKGTKLYHRLINKFFELTGVPMVLNTSFNTIKGEPIVEKPRGAMVSFLTRAPELSCLVLGDYLVERREVTVGLGDKFEVNGGFSLTTREVRWQCCVDDEMT